MLEFPDDNEGSDAANINMYFECFNEQVWWIPEVHILAGCKKLFGIHN